MVQPKADKPQEQKLTTQRLNEMAFSFRNAGTLIAAIELNLFTKIAEGTTEPAEVAGKIGIPTDSAERLMIACAALGLLEKKNNKYVNAPDVNKYLVEGSPTYFGDYLVWQTREEYDWWKNFASYLKPKRGRYEIMNDPEIARAFTIAGYNSSISAGHKLAKEFDFSPYSLFLDLGGGSGCYSIAAALRYPQLQAIVFDQPNVVTVTEEFIAQAGLSDRVKTYSGNFFTDEFPKGADLIGYITPLQGYDVEDVQSLIKKAYDVLEPGGSIIILDYMLNEDKTGPLVPAFFNLRALTEIEPGRVNSTAEFREFLGRAGFVDIEVCNFLPGSIWRVTGKKPK